MNKPLIAALCASLALGACSTISQSRLNPFNWFGGSEETVVQRSPLDKPADRRLLVHQVTEMKLEKMPGGVIIRATGLPPTQGFWDAELVARPAEDGQCLNPAIARSDGGRFLVGHQAGGHSPDHRPR
jgi:hypothetical protein